MKVQIDLGDAGVVELDEPSARQIRDRLCDVFGLPDMVSEYGKSEYPMVRVEVW